jgi:hypothetical protein
VSSFQPGGKKLVGMKAFGFTGQMSRTPKKNSHHDDVGGISKNAHYDHELIIMLY